MLIKLVENSKKQRFERKNNKRENTFSTNYNKIITFSNCPEV